VPDLTGMSVAEAKPALAEVGLILRIASYAESEDVPEGVILSQDASPGGKAYPGATVAVTVSSGPPPALEPSPEPRRTPEQPEEGAPVESPNVEPPEVELPEVKPVEPVGETDALKGELPIDLEAGARSGAGEGISRGVRPGSRKHERRPGAKEKRRRPDRFRRRLERSVG
jgi:PASTA domain-containing protein